MPIPTYPPKVDVPVKLDVPATERLPAKLRDVDHWEPEPEEVKTVLAAPIANLAKVLVAEA